MLRNILFAIWFFLPAGGANASSLFIHKIPGLKLLSHPLDFNKKRKGRIIFGKNKTWGGLILALAIAVTISFIEHLVYAHSLWARSISGPINYNSINYWALGALLGFGAILGDTIESFFKRRLAIKPGSLWFPYDQIDFIVGGCILSLFIVQLNIANYLLVLIVWFLVNIISSYIGYQIGIKDRPI